MLCDLEPLPIHTHKLLVGSEGKLMYHTAARFHVIISIQEYWMIVGDLRIFKRI